VSSYEGTDQVVLIVVSVLGGFLGFIALVALAVYVAKQVWKK